MLGAALSWVEVLLLVLLVAMPVMWVSALVSAVRVPGPAWRATGRRKNWYLSAIATLNVAAAAYYWLVIRSQVRDAARDRQ